MPGPTAEDVLRREVSKGNLTQHVEALCRWERVSGKEGELRAAEYIVGVLEELGVPHTLHELKAYVSYPVEAQLRVIAPSPEQIGAITHSFSASTGPQEVVGPLALASRGELEAKKLGGKVVLTDGMALPWRVKEVEAAGAVAHINACDSPEPHEMCTSPVWGTPELSQVDRLPHLPVLSINRQGEEHLKALLRRGRVDVALQTKVWTGWATLKLPAAEIKGPRSSDDFVLAGSHYDAWYVGATDTATSDALLLEMARLLWEQRDDLLRAVRLAWWPGHSQGRYAGSAWYADRFWRDLYHHGVAYLNLDGPGSRHVDRFRLSATADIADFNRRSITELSGMRVEERASEESMGLRGRPGRNADQSFLGLGLPSLAAYGEMPPDHPDRGTHAMASGGGWYWHTPEDTIDKVDFDLLVLETFVFAAQVARLATTKVIPLVLKHTAEDILHLLHLYADAAGDIVDFEEAHREARRFREDCGNLEVHKRAVESLGDEWKAAALNTELLKLTRIINPVLYTTAGPFRQDPAEPQFLLPGLAPPLSSAEILGEGRGFLRVQLTRELNRVTHALDAASTLVEAHLREEMEEYD